MAVDINKLITEGRNPNTMDIDLLPTENILQKINNEDKIIADIVAKAIPAIAALVDKATEILAAGGRLIYIGAGTSGRVGILDAVECPPTFGIPYDTVQAVMAGGAGAFIKAKEGAEDRMKDAAADLKAIDLTPTDILVGITASGRTPYVIGGINYANSIGCATASVSTSAQSEVSALVCYPIEAVTGPEVIAGSTRMKAGTAQKMICNMISTAVMIKLGKVYENLMIDVNPSNEKLVSRARNILTEAAGISLEKAKDYITKYKTVKKALFSILSGLKEVEEVEKYLHEAKGNIRKALEVVNNEKTR